MPESNSPQGPVSAVCRCGERVETFPSLSARCPACGRRLFWQCSCGALVQDASRKCPYCGKQRYSSVRSDRPPLRLRVILAAGLVGAILFAFFGSIGTKLFVRFGSSSNGLTNPQPAAIPEGGNFLVVALRGIGLVLLDFVQLTRSVLVEQPWVGIFALLGFLVAATIVARRQQFSFRRLRRHLRRRWREWQSRWL